MGSFLIGMIGIIIVFLTNLAIPFAMTFVEGCETALYLLIVFSFVWAVISISIVMCCLDYFKTR